MEEKLTYFDSKPNLISNKIIRSIDKIFNNNIEVNEFIMPENNFWSNIYTNFIQPNFLAIMAISIVIIFLVIRYLIKKEEEHVKKPKKHKPKKQIKTQIVKYDDVQHIYDVEVQDDKINNNIDNIDNNIDNIEDIFDNNILEPDTNTKLNFDELSSIMYGN